MNNKNLGGRVNRRKVWVLGVICLLMLPVVALGCGDSDKPPAVAILSLSEGAMVSGTTDIVASATDDKEIASVEYSIHSGPDPVIVHMDYDPATGHYRARWDTSTVTSGAHTLTITATDNAGQTDTYSISVQVLQYWAVVVGVGEYAYLEGDTSPNDDDARALYQTLSHLWGEDHVKLLVDADATKADIRTAITGWLAPREETGDTVVYFFAGHSLADERYMLPYDCDSRPTSISGDELDGWLDTLDSKRVVVILETCEAGKFTGDLAEPGRVILMSSEEDEASHGSDDGFVFPHYLMEALTSLEETDFNRDGRVSAEEIFKYVAPKVTALLTRYDIAQHPQLSDGCQGEVVLITLK